MGEKDRALACTARQCGREQCSGQLKRNGAKWSVYLSSANITTVFMYVNQIKLRVRRPRSAPNSPIRIAWIAMRGPSCFKFPFDTSIDVEVSTSRFVMVRRFVPFSVSSRLLPLSWWTDYRPLYIGQLAKRSHTKWALSGTYNLVEPIRKSQRDMCNMISWPNHSELSAAPDVMDLAAIESVYLIWVWPDRFAERCESFIHVCLFPPWSRSLPLLPLAAFQWNFAAKTFENHRVSSKLVVDRML